MDAFRFPGHPTPLTPRILSKLCDRCLDEATGCPQRAVQSGVGVTSVLKFQCSPLFPCVVIDRTPGVAVPRGYCEPVNRPPIIVSPTVPSTSLWFWYRRVAARREDPLLRAGCKEYIFAACSAPFSFRRTSARSGRRFPPAGKFRTIPPSQPLVSHSHNGSNIVGY